MTGRQAVDLGLAAQAVSGEQLETATLELAKEIAQANALALATMKKMARRAMELPLTDGLRYERWMQHCYRTRSPSLEASVHGFAARPAD
jgi:enoyl-CoA hydratase/carnithine racemase